MGKRRGYTPRAAQKPADAETGAAVVRKFVLELFDRKDGKAADWPLLADTLFRAAFDALDEAPGDPRRESLLRRVHAGAYNRLVGNDDDDSAEPAAKGQGAPATGLNPKPVPSSDFTS